jgi:hypothetical protein
MDAAWPDRRRRDAEEMVLRFLRPQPGDGA